MRIVTASLIILAATLPAAAQSDKPLEIPQPKGTWQVPKEIQQPKGTWQTPGESCSRCHGPAAFRAAFVVHGPKRSLRRRCGAGRQRHRRSTPWIRLTPGPRIFEIRTNVVLC